MSSHSTNLGTSRAQTPEQDENEREPLENASRAPTVEPVRRNLTKSDLNTLLSKQDEVIEKQDARMDRQDQMMEALLAQMRTQQQPTVITPNTTQKATDPSYFCGGAAELDNFLSHLKQNFDLYPHRWPSDKHKVAYASGLMRPWADHKRKELRTSKATDPSNWATDLRSTPDDPCNQDFEAFEEALRRVYGDPDRRADASHRCFTELKQGHHDPHETSRQYEQRCRAAWREAGWPTGELGTQHILYDQIWSGLHPAIKSRIKPLCNDETGRFKDLDELFRRAHAADQIKDIQARQQSASSSSTAPHQPSSERGKKRPFRPSISSRSDTPATPTASSTKPPARYKNKAEVDNLITRGLCPRCEQSGHQGWSCPTYSKAVRPSESSSLGTGSNTGAVKRQRSFDNRSNSTGNPSTSKN
jgi:hypothetical protein